MVALSTYYGGSLNTGLLAYQSAFLAADLNSLAAGAAVMSSLLFDNTVSPDEFMDLSFVGAMASAQAITVGNNIGVALAYLQADGTTYGDGRLAAGFPATLYTPVQDVCAGFAFAVNASTATAVASSCGLIALRPRKFRLIVLNGLPAALASSGNMVSMSTYKIRSDATT
jgi:hypothetical protein